MSHSGNIRWLAPWLGVSVAAASVLTAFDAALLHRRHGYFSGGFLATDYISSWQQGVAFILVSLLCDLAIVGVLTALVLRVCSRFELSKRDSVVLAFMIALTPVVTADFVQYRLESFLGDAFDFALMFDLAGRDPGEILAVASYQVSLLLAGLVGGIVVFASFIWLLRRNRRRLRSLSLPTRGQASVGCASLLLIGAVTTSLARLGSDTLDNGLRRKPTGQLLGALSALASDLDRDGYGAIGRLKDAAPLDSSIYPFAVDIPGNGIDEDSVGGDLPDGSAPYREPNATTVRWASTPTVVLIALESFRADAVGAAVDGRAVTPVLSRLAKAGVASDHAYSHNGYTVQSRQHLFSGSLAGLRRTTLIDDFNAQGYETAYFSGQDESFGGAGADVGFTRASKSYDARQDIDRRYSTFTTPGSLALPHELIVERIRSFLSARQPARPLFLYVNFHDTHYPYHHNGLKPLLHAPVLRQNEIVPANASSLRTMYLNTAANVDAAIGKVLELVRTTAGAEPGVIVLADHGESLFDEGFLGHGYSLNEAQTRIPFVVSGLPMRVIEPFGQSDLRDALLESMTRDAPGSRPVLAPDSKRSVFQYLGGIDTPVQIGLRGLESQALYDFRFDRARFDGSNWRRPGDLVGHEKQVFLELIHRWELMRLARGRL